MGEKGASSFNCITFSAQSNLAHHTIVARGYERRPNYREWGRAEALCGDENRLPLQRHQEEVHHDAKAITRGTLVVQ